MTRCFALWWAVLTALSLSVASGHGRAAGEAPRLSVVLVLDASGSMKKNDPDLLARLAAKLFVDLADARDRLTIVSFGSASTKLASGSGNERAALFGAIERVGRDDECTDYARGLEAAAAEFASAPAAGERRLVLFMTDGQLEPKLPDKDGCGRFEAAREDERNQASASVMSAAAKLTRAKAKVYSVGLGDKLASARHSRALLEELSKRTGGRFVEARRAEQLPEFFAGIFAALVGAPVGKYETPGDRLRFVVPEDSGQVHVIVPSDDPATSVRIERAGAAVSAGRGPELRLERGRRARGYVVTWLSKPAAGDYELVRTGGKGALRAWVISDVGLSLRIENLGPVLAETETPVVRVALRSRGGKPVPLDPAFLQKVTFEVEVAGKPALRVPANGRDAIELRGERLAPRPAPYLIRASASHAEGFLQVDSSEHSFRVIHQIPLALDESVKIGFDTMAEEGPIPLASPAVVRVVAPPDLPADLKVQLELAPGPMRDDLRFSPASVEFGPGKPREQTISVSFADPESLRGKDQRYTGELRLVLAPEHAQLASGKKQWALPVDGTLRSWTLGRYLREYRWQIAIGLGLLLLVIWLVGRAVARDFPKKARIHYVEVGQAFESDSLIRRFAKKGAYRSAKLGFPLGKKARKLVYFVATGAGFEVRPEKHSPVTIVGEADGERRTAFRGAWEQRYRLGDRWEVWLTRS